MHKVLLCFKVIRTGKILEVCFDDRLSFEENFRMLEKISETGFRKLIIYDPIKKIFLDRTIPLSEFNLKTLALFYLFT